MGNIKYFKITINKKIIKQKEATNNQVVNSGCNEKDRSEVGKAMGLHGGPMQWVIGLGGQDRESQCHV